MIIDLVIDVISMKDYALNYLHFRLLNRLDDSRILQSIFIFCLQFGQDLRTDGGQRGPLYSLDPVVGLGIQLVFIGGKHEAHLVVRILIEGYYFSIVLMHQLDYLQLVRGRKSLATLFKDPLRAFNQHLGELIVGLDPLLDSVLDFILEAPEPGNRLLPLLPGGHCLSQALCLKEGESRE
jgi:hypothetical protein